MIKVYFKQAWQLLRQNKLYSTVYIIGTGLAIAATMVIAIVYYIKIAPLYPEMNRDRMLVMNSLLVKYKDSNRMSGSFLSYQFVKDHLYTLKTAEITAAELIVWDDYPLIEMANGKGMLPVKVKYVDDNFWKAFEFRFVQGKAFTQADFQSAIKTAVISSSLANTLFGTVNVEGMRMTLDGNDYRICGVVQNVSSATPISYAQVWVPYTIRPEDLKGDRGEGLLGAMKAYIFAPTSSEMGKVKEEVDGIIQKMNSSQEKYEVLTSGTPDIYWQSIFRRPHSMGEIDWLEVGKTFGTILLALLIIPAVNLAGMVSSRMEKRLPEFGIRKSFGASRNTLLGQVLTENFLLTSLGGIVGLVFSYLMVYTSKSWVLTLFDAWPGEIKEGSESFLTIGMLFNPTVFLIAFGVCFLLNYLSAIIPAYHGLKKRIVYSLNQGK